MSFYKDDIQEPVKTPKKEKGPNTETKIFGPGRSIFYLIQTEHEKANRKMKKIYQEYPVSSRSNLIRKNPPVNIGF